MVGKYESLVEIELKPKLFSLELHKCYFLYVHKKICSKVPILSYFVKRKCISGDCYINYFLTDKTALQLSLSTVNKLPPDEFLSKQTYLDAYSKVQLWSTNC